MEQIAKELSLFNVSLFDHDKITKLMNEIDILRNKNTELENHNKKLQFKLNIVTNSIPRVPPVVENENVEENVKCAVCIENKVNTVFGCSHVVCNKCADLLKLCPVCREDIDMDRVMYFRL